LNTGSEFAHIAKLENSSLIKIAVMGAGAVGCYYGAMLARAGHRVTMIGRAQHIEAMKKNGLMLETSSFSEALPVEATIEATGVKDAELVLFCVKSDDTTRAGEEIAPYLDPQAALICLQNGVDNAVRLEGVLGRPVTPAAVYVAVEMAGAGHVRHHGRGDLILGQSQSSAELASLLTAVGVPTEVSDNVIGELWAKLIVNCAYNAISAIAQLPYGRMTKVAGVRDVMRDVVTECVAVAAQQNVRLPENVAETVLGLAELMPNQFSSTAQDLARGRRSEIGHLNGYVVRTGQACGVATPVNRALLSMVRLLEDKIPATR
jgi:2-dehydropantoate 2-reductase